MNYGVKLTQELENTILAAIRQGAWIHHAFRLAGVPDRIWRKWMDTTVTRGKLYHFQNKIKQAQAMACFIANQEIKKNDPFKWAANGPGRDAPGEPGWAAMTNPIEPTDTKSTDPMQFPEFVRFVNNVRLVMAMYPDARKMLDELNAQTEPIAIGETKPEPMPPFE